MVIPQVLDVRQQASSFKHHFSGFTWRLWYAVALFGTMGVARGIEEALVGTMVEQQSFIADFGLDAMDDNHRASITGNVVAMSQLGCIAGALLTLFVGDRLGRLWWGRIMCSLWLLGILIYTTSVGNLGQMYGGKFIVGIGLGQMSVIAPAYCAECCHSENRGFAVAIFGATEYVGAIIGYFVNYGTAVNMSDSSSKQWKLPQITAGIFAAIFLAMLVFAVESPRILMKQGKRAQAKAALQKLRGNLGDAAIEQEMGGIDMQITAERDSQNLGILASLASLFFTRRNIDRLTLACTAHLLQVWSGASSITVYAPRYFDILGVRGDNERLLYTAIVGVVKLVAAASCALFAIDQLGRRKSLTAGITVQLFCITYIAAVLSVVPELAEGVDTPRNERVGVSAIVFMYLCGAGYAFGWNSLSYLITSEIFPLQTRTVGTAFVMLVHYGSRYGMQKAVPLMLLDSAMRPLGTFWFFSGMTLTGIIWVWAWLPETGSMQLEKAAYMLESESIDDPWGDGSQQGDAKKMGEMQPKSGPRKMGEGQQRGSVGDAVEMKGGKGGRRTVRRIN